jgi:hypothetical protein
MDAIKYTDHKYGVEIPVHDIKIDLDVQRATVPSRVRKLAANFNPDYLGELLVSERADGNYVLDGGHRLRVCQETGLVGVLTCEVFTGLSKADEARLFMGRNDRANIAKLDRDRNMNTAGDALTLAVQMASQAAGYVFIATQIEDSTFRDRAAAISIMRDASRAWVEDEGPAHLQKVLEFYARTWDRDHRPVSSVLRAASKVLVSKAVQQGSADLNRLSERLHGLPDEEVAAMAVRHRDTEQLHRSISLVTAAAEVMEEQYNRGLPADQRLRLR